jgi:hypothetical protein
MSRCSYRLPAAVLGASALLGGLAGCSTHPQIDDVSRTSTVDIVKSVRCEALAGLEKLYNDLTPAERKKAEPIITTSVIGYDFEFVMEESNRAGGKKEPDNGLAKLERAFTSKPSTLEISGQGKLERNNTRRFTIIEPLTELARSRDICGNRTKGANWTYPVTGTIGFDEVVRTYVRLEMLGELLETKRDEVTTKFPNAHMVFSDELKFTTHFQAGAEGTLVLDAVAGRLSLTNATIGVSASRRDVHSVVVALARATDEKEKRAKGGTTKAKSEPKEAAKSSKQPAKAKEAAKTTGKTKETARAPRTNETARDERDRMIKEGSVRDPRAQARLIQMNATAQDSVAVELHRRRNLNDRDDEAARALGQRLLDLLKLP